MRQTTAKILYGLLFVAVIPALLIAWARALTQVLPALPVLGTSAFGWALALAGFGVMVAGWWALMRHGRGLPMNLAPPPRLVTGGPYAVIGDPIYTGFSLLMVGSFMATDMRAGLWVVAPSVMLGSVALVFGYERHAMRARFGPVRWPTLLRMPAHGPARPTAADRCSAYAALGVAWLANAALGQMLGAATDRPAGLHIWEGAGALPDWHSLLGVGCVALIVVAPLVTRTSADLRAFMQTLLSATALSLLSALLLAWWVPAILLLTLCAAWWFGRTLGQRLGWALLALVASSLARTDTGASAVLLTCAIFLCARNRAWLWGRALQAAEATANSWRTWRLGPWRIIIHAAYSGLAGLVGMLIAAHLAGTAQVPFLVLIGIAALLGAGIWGQFLKGSANLARPFGYFGALIGGAVGLGVAQGLGGNGWRIAAALAVAIPFTQAIGRVRCLVQGCCHGKACAPAHGIVVRSEKSRVVYLAGLGGQPIYPTPLYSLGYNLVLGPLLLHGWLLGLPLPFLSGMYLVLSGIGRFIEESYRGEPQTPYWHGLAVYQWLAVGGVIIGAFLTTCAGPTYTPALAPQPDALGAALVIAVVAACAMSTDFPESQRRFSRLAPP
jgi:protein-S-isoprenylcysteine O-methyltransferase Ste14